APRRDGRIVDPDRRERLPTLKAIPPATLEVWWRAVAQRRDDGVIVRVGNSGRDGALPRAFGGPAALRGGAALPTNPGERQSSRGGSRQDDRGGHSRTKPKPESVDG